jgi:hypothetical protein
MLLNLSNHPSENWSKEQTELARKQFGKVVDMPFPHVPPDVDAEGVLALAEQYYQHIITRSLKQKRFAVHLMGELSFCFALVKMLQKQGIMVVCSTTQRTVLEEIDGKKTTQFKFHQFRVYG